MSNRPNTSAIPPDYFQSGMNEYPDTPFVNVKQEPLSATDKLPIGRKKTKILEVITISDSDDDSEDASEDTNNNQSSFKNSEPTKTTGLLDLLLHPPPDTARQVSYNAEESSDSNSGHGSAKSQSILEPKTRRYDTIIIDSDDDAEGNTDEAASAQCSVEDCEATTNHNLVNQESVQLSLDNVKQETSAEESHESRTCPGETTSSIQDRSTENNAQSVQEEPGSGDRHSDLEIKLEASKKSVPGLASDSSESRLTVRDTNGSEEDNISESQESWDLPSWSSDTSDSPDTRTSFSFNESESKRTSTGRAVARRSQGRWMRNRSVPRTNLRPVDPDFAVDDVSVHRGTSVARRSRGRSFISRHWQTDVSDKSSNHKDVHSDASCRSWDSVSDIFSASNVLKDSVSEISSAFDVLKDSTSDIFSASNILKEAEADLHCGGTINLTAVSEKVYKNCKFAGTRLCHHMHKHPDQQVVMNCCCLHPKIKLFPLRKELGKFIEAQIRKPLDNLRLPRKISVGKKSVDDDRSEKRNDSSFHDRNKGSRSSRHEVSVTEGVSNEDVICISSDEDENNTEDPQPSCSTWQPEIGRINITQDSIISCTLCKEQFGNPLILLHHIKTVHQKKKRNRCIFCEEVHHHIDGHILRSHKDIMVCVSCHKFFKSKQELAQHSCRTWSRRRSTKKQQKPVCIVCQKVFSNELALIQHFRTVHKVIRGLEKDKCIYCDKKRQKIMQHIAMAHKKKIRGCVNCYNIFIDVKSYANHKCDDISLTSPFPRHVSFPRQPLVADIHGGKMLMSHDQLKKNHMNQRRKKTVKRAIAAGRQAKQCVAWFIEAGYVHEDGQTCKKCGYKSDQNSNLLRHLQIHTRIGKHASKESHISEDGRTCKLCGFQGENKTAVLQHVDDMHVISILLKCEFCKAYFETARSIACHMRFCHKQ